MLLSTDILLKCSNSQTYSTSKYSQIKGNKDSKRNIVLLKQQATFNLGLQCYVFFCMFVGLHNVSFQL